MIIKTKIFDLDEVTNHNYATLFTCHNKLSEAKVLASELKEEAIYKGALSEAVACEQQLYFINKNLEIIEVAILFKEGEAFEFEQYDLICQN